MKPLRIVQIALLSLAASMSSSSAHADVAPPPDYVEQCTLAKQQVAGTSCITCSAYYGDVNKCVNQYSPEGYTKVCKTSGASSWTEVHCKPTTTGTAGAAGMSGVAGATSADAVVPASGGTGSDQLIAPVSGGATLKPTSSSVSTGGTPVSKTTSAVVASTGGKSTVKASTTSASTTSPSATGGSASETTESPKPSADDGGGCSISGRWGSSTATASLALAALAVLGLRRRRRGA